MHASYSVGSWQNVFLQTTRHLKTRTARLQSKWLVVVLISMHAFVGFLPAARGQSIDRQALVARHAMQFDRYDAQSPASLGNGEFAFSFDVTGLQTFPSDESGHTPLGTMAQWGWHSAPGADKANYSDTLKNYLIQDREVSYSTDQSSDAAKIIRANPHKFNLAQIGLKLASTNGSVTAADLIEPHQIVDLWRGVADSTFQLNGVEITVTTVVHPVLDAIAFRIESPLVATGKVGVDIRFAYPAAEWGPKGDDWSHPERHISKLSATSGNHFRIDRVLDETEYEVHVFTGGTVSGSEMPHHFAIQNDSNVLDAVVWFTPQSTDVDALTFEDVKHSAEEYWESFWTHGGVVDLSGSSDERWKELERRVVQSQFLTAIHCSGSMPPQETGLVCNSWFGKAHLEMHWWHAAHFPLWQRPKLLERSMEWYRAILPMAKGIAVRQGYSGIRWPKMTGPDGVSSPSGVGELLIWQQPHPIYLAELLYRNNPSDETIAKYIDLIEPTADFMADYAHYESSADRYVLGPVLIPAQECYNGRVMPGVMNPAYELAYWRWGLNKSAEWMQRAGRTPNKKWSEVAAKIAKPHIRDGIYTAIENEPFTNRRDHPSMLAALGVMPDVGLVDREVMRQTYQDVVADWDWESTWGWDYPMMAMTAARLGDGEAAVAALLKDAPKNHYLPNGQCWQADRLPLYLPANGGLLMAVGMMAAGWDGSQGDAPGFPANGRWSVKFEGINPMP